MTVNLVRSISPISPISASSFLRFVGLSFEDAAEALGAWWESAQRGGAVAIGDQARLGPVRLGTDVAHVSLRLRHHRRPGAWLPMELEVTPWTQSPASTRLEVVALRRVHLGARYFEVGHAVLDAITSELVDRQVIRPTPAGKQRRLDIGTPMEGVVGERADAAVASHA